MKEASRKMKQPILYWKVLFNKGFVVNVAQVLQESQERMQVLKKAESPKLLQSVFLYLEDHPI